MNHYSLLLVAIISHLNLCQSDEIFSIPITDPVDDTVEFIEYNRNQVGCERLEESVGEQCKFYGECCGDPVRIRERLHAETFQCTNIGERQGYVVTKCPISTDKELKSLCSQPHISDLSLSSWPVTGTYTGITYSNLYCAICNGALSPVIDDPSEVFDPQAALEFWTNEIFCSNGTVANIANDEEIVTAAMLEELLKNGECWANMVPTLLPIHRQQCGRDISRCPLGYPSDDMTKLCAKGPFNQICINGESYPCQDGAYRNIFCKHCWDNKTLPVLDIADFPTKGRLLLTARPHIQSVNDSINWFSEHSFGVHELSVPYTLSCRNNGSWYQLERYNDSASEQEFWDLGSILCYSKLSTVCGEYIVFPDADDSLNSCSAPGCTVNGVQDLTNTCTSIDQYSFDTELLYDRKFLWSDQHLGDSLSSCANGNDASNCICDTRCHFFGECCIDADSPPMMHADEVKVLDTSAWTCHPFYYSSDIGLVVIDSCPDNTTDEAALCARGNIGDWDPFSLMVSDGLTKLTYKNRHCANCHKASHLIFWDALMICPMIGGLPRGPCLFKEYSPPNNQNDLFYPCRLDFDKPITSCPQEYSDWKLSRNCEHEPVSFVFKDRQIYKNYHCAICNIGDKMQQVELLSYKRPKVKEMSQLIELRKTVYNNASIHLILLSYEKKSCCVTCLGTANEQCQLVDLSNNQWGTAPMGHNGSCINVPFDLSCDAEDSGRVHNPSQTLHFNYLCPGVDLSCSTIVTTTPCLNCSSSTTNPPITEQVITTAASNNKPSFGGHGGGDGSALGEMFKPSKPITIYKTETHVVASNDSYQFCSEGAIVSFNMSNIIKIFLTPEGILVKRSKTVATEMPGSKRELLIHDYILIALSLVSILGFILYTAIAKKKPLNLPDKMMVALLVSLFGALICFALSTTATGNSGCRVLASVMQFFFLATLTWSNSMAISIVKSLYTLRLSAHTNLTFIIYTLYSFGLPSLFSLITIALSRIENEKFAGSVYETETICFIGNPIVLCTCFLVPIYLLIVCNFVIAVIVMVKIIRSGNVGASQKKNKTQKHIISCVKVSACLGLGWIFLFVSTFCDCLWLPMQALVELQGFFVVIFNLIGWNCVNRVKSWSSGFVTDKTKSTPDKGPAIDPVEAIALSNGQIDDESSFSDQEKP